MAKTKKSEREPDVKVHHSAGCVICGSTRQHAHTQDDWRAMLNSLDTRR